MSAAVVADFRGKKQVFWGTQEIKEVWYGGQKLWSSGPTPFKVYDFNGFSDGTSLKTAYPEWNLQQGYMGISTDALLEPLGYLALALASLPAVAASATVLAAGNNVGLGVGTTQGDGVGIYGSDNGTYKLGAGGTFGALSPVYDTGIFYQQGDVIGIWYDTSTGEATATVNGQDTPPYYYPISGTTYPGILMKTASLDDLKLYDSL